MGQSLSKLYVHLIFGTKNRLPLINKEFEQRLYSYLAGTFKKYESTAIIINGAADHVHILFVLSKNIALAKLLEEVKKQSSKWIKTIDKNNQKFAWQIGYAAFSVSGSKVDVVKKYIENQKEHHKKKTFREEVEEFLKQYDVIEYDEKYFWS
ncbi:MAG: IS200/IS605 family transposase [Bacteroidales bacterium]|nr:IS200/IS605 family transposase [Bacteroidales bacterium]